MVMMSSDMRVLSAGHSLRDQAGALADALVACEFGRDPRLRARYGPAGRAQAREGAVDHFLHLADALDMKSPALFNDHIGWVKVLLAQRGAGDDDVDHRLACMLAVARDQLPAPVVASAVSMIEGTTAALAAMPGTTTSFLDPGHRLFALASEYVHTLLGGYRAAAGRLAFDAAERGEPVRALYLDVLQPALHEIGRLWQMNKINVAQEHFCSAATQVVMSQLLPRVVPDEASGRSVVVVCVGGERHELGARMVQDFFEMAGWDTYFCGADTPHDAVVESVVERAADLLAVSATMGCHVHAVHDVIARVRADPRCAGQRVMAGGHPFGIDPGLWRTVGADGTARDAATAVELAAQWMPR
jgi:methanogenic corrinoid protein MtbC1